MKQCPSCGVRYDERASRCPIDGAGLFSVPDPLIGRVVQERYLIEALLGAIEGVSGVLLCGISTAFIFAVMTAMLQIRMQQQTRPATD